jgi:hypothetical protein
MYKDEIIAEVWRIRDAYVEEHHHDLKQIIADLILRQKATHFKIVDRRTSDKTIQHNREGFFA